MAKRSLKTDLDSLQSKAKERTVKTQNIEYDLDSLVKRIARGAIKLNPDYQRRHRWPDEVSSRLIESLLLNIPIPTIFISQDIDVDEEAEEQTSRYTVIDGQQRLTAIYEFMKNDLKLTGLEVLSEINDCRLKDLPPFLTRRLEERTIKCLRIDSTLDPQVKFDIFERLNTGSVKLESQELRNAVARGPFNDAIKNWATHEDFRRLIQVPQDDPESSIKVQKMEDVELVLRFFALRNGGFQALKKGFRQFLTDSLIEFNSLDEADIKRKGQEFRRYMTFIHSTFGEYAFAKHRVEGGVSVKRMSSFNAAVYDAVAVGLAESFTTRELREDPERIARRMRGYISLFEDDNFLAAVTGSVNDAAKVKTRIDAMISYLRR